MAVKNGTEVRIINRNSGMALQATGDENGQVVLQAEISSDPAQIWIILLQKGHGRIKFQNKATGKILDVMMGGSESGTYAQTWDDVDGHSQIWAISGRVYKKITHLYSGKVLDIAYLSQDAGANAQIWEDLGGENQQWRLVEVAEADLPAKPRTATVRRTSPKKSTSALVAEKVETTTKQPNREASPKARQTINAPIAKS